MVIELADAVSNFDILIKNSELRILVLLANDKTVSQRSKHR